MLDQKWPFVSSVRSSQSLRTPVPKVCMRNLKLFHQDKWWSVATTVEPYPALSCSQNFPQPPVLYQSCLRPKQEQAPASPSCPAAGSWFVEEGRVPPTLTLASPGLHLKRAGLSSTPWGTDKCQIHEMWLCLDFASNNYIRIDLTNSCVVLSMFSTPYNHVFWILL